MAGGADLQVVKERLGHGSITTTEKYLHTLPGHHDAALSALDNIRPTTPTVPAAASETPTTVAATSAPVQACAPSAPAPAAAAVGGIDPAALLAALGPDLAQQMLAGLLQQTTGNTPGNASA